MRSVDSDEWRSNGDGGKAMSDSEAFVWSGPGYYRNRRGDVLKLGYDKDSDYPIFAVTDWDGSFGQFEEDGRYNPDDISLHQQCSSSLPSSRDFLE